MKPNFPSKGSIISLILSAINFVYEVFGPDGTEDEKKDANNKDNEPELE